MKFFKSLFLSHRFFIVWFAIISLFIGSYFYAFLFFVGVILFVILLVTVVIDIMILFSKNYLNAERQVNERLSNGDENEITINVQNLSTTPIHAEIIDELPFQFQKRDFSIKVDLKSNDAKRLKYTVRPVTRGEYSFGNLNVFVNTYLGLVKRKFIFSQDQKVSTYPSFHKLREYELLAFSSKFNFSGHKKIRRIGQSTHFDQIKEYVLGDERRHINWKSSAKKGALMVNQFQEEKSQPIYSIIDKGRVMKMPFNEMSLLDYSINATLAISDVALLKHDKVGMLTFSNDISNIIVAERRNHQMQLLMESLYNLNTDFKETDFGKLYAFTRMKLTHRSLLFIYTNFETMDALKRQIRYLKAISKLHLVVCIFFKNTELDDVLNKIAENVLEIVDKTVAEKYNYEKRLIAAELKKYGIHTILSRPEELSIQTINKYLELKAIGLI